HLGRAAGGGNGIGRADLIVFDLDGCLADDSHRRFLIQGKARNEAPEAWARYHSMCRRDVPIAPIVGLLRRLHTVEFCEVWTARDEEVFAATSIWLRDH